MKKLQLLAYAGAIALLSTGITACSDDNLTQEVTPSPGYNPKTGEVTADFVFNVSTGTNGSTRMSSDAVQASINTTTGELFRGIEDATMFAFKVKNSDGSLKDGWHISYAPDPTPSVKKFDLGTVMGKGTIVPAGDGTTAPQSRRVVEVNLPTETNTLLFYGKAIKGNSSDKEQGSSEMSVDETGNMNNIFFRLNKIIPAGSDLQTEFLQTQRLIAAVLTKIVRTSYTLPADATVDGRTAKANTTYRWSDYVTIVRNDPTNKPSVIDDITRNTNDPVIPQGGTAGPMSMLGEILADTYVTFNKIYNQGGHSELRAGAGPDISRMMSDLYTVLAHVKDAEPTSLEETIAKRLAGEICGNINYCFGTTGTWESNSRLIEFVGFTSVQTSKIGNDKKLTDFPKDRFNLPYGATILQFIYNSTSDVNAPEYAYQGAVPTYAMGGSTGSTSSFNPENWCYPPELMYFGNSPIRVTDLTKGTNEYPDGTTNWTNSTNTRWNGWTDNGHVLSTTRSVAMRDCINYGNALLKMNVKYGTNTLEDNNHQIQYERTGANENDNIIDVTQGGFEVTGIAIGGQNRSVGWNFIPRLDPTVDGSATAPQFGCMVYDSALPSNLIPNATGAAGGTPSADNYTLLWDNYDTDLYGQSQRTVYVALEFKNNTGKDFWGMNNLIRKGGTFYITAKLDPDAILVTDKTADEIKADKSLGITWPSTYEMPPYYTKEQAAAKNDNTLDSKTIKERRVFMQDYVTEATFVLQKNSLKYALIAVPDLRSTQISLGLSVDLNWNKGLKFDNVPLAGGQ